ncbi:MAG: signal recognition particle-docking protein FtsY [Actinomycetales bacterium]
MGKFSDFFSRFGSSKTTSADLQSFRDLLIDADFGRVLADQILEESTNGSSDLRGRVSESILRTLVAEPRKLNLAEARLTTILIMGVNGTGKTTSAAKIAAYLRESGRTVALAACDTFRAAAVDQLVTWGKRLGVPVVTGNSKADPAAVAFDAVERAKRETIDVLIIDTAGRLHNQDNLMQELSKIERVVAKVSPIDEKLFVLDGTTGQNGVAQALAFRDAVGLTGIVVTKLDGSAKGGIALAVERELQVPVKLIGTGERLSDLAEFEPKTYLEKLLT